LQTKGHGVKYPGYVKHNFKKLVMHDLVVRVQGSVEFACGLKARELAFGMQIMAPKIISKSDSVNPSMNVSVGGSLLSAQGNASV
jgi:hypothetical protein